MLWLFGRKTTEVKCHSYYIILIAINWLRAAFVRILNCEILFLPFWKLLSASHTNLRDLCYTSLRQEYQHKLFGIPVSVSFFSSPNLCIFLIINLHKYGLIENCFIFRLVIQYYFVYFCLLNYSSCDHQMLNIFTGIFCVP